MKDLRFAKLVLFVNGLVPGTLLLWEILYGQAGANPVNYAIRTTGLLALTFLALSLAVTPLRKLTGFSSLFHFRRQLGLYAFFYALAHFSIFFIFDRGLDVVDTFSEMTKRLYLIVGSVGLLAMVPLAVTSTSYMIKRLGPKRWQLLHRLAYVAAIAGVVHFYMLVKSDIRLPVAFGVVVGTLLGYRLVVFVANRLRPVSPDRRGWSGLLRVNRIIQETPDVRTFQLVPQSVGTLPFVYLPGQYLTFSLPIGGKTVRRSYTIASSPTTRDHCEVTIKRDGQGLVSRHMHDNVKVGDELLVSAAAGRFTFVSDGADALALVAGGVGITPLMSILRYLTDRHWAGQIYLVYCNRTEADIIFRKELEALQRTFPNVHLTLTLTRVDGTNWDGPVGRVDADLLMRVIPNLTSIPFYLCGPTEMLTATHELLRQLGVSEQNIHTESFGSQLPAASYGSATSASDTKYKVTFSRSNKLAETDNSRPLLALAEELGIDIDYQCRSGICGRCKCRLVAGSVEMEIEDALDSADRRDNVILLCQARVLENVTVEA